MSKPRTAITLAILTLAAGSYAETTITHTKDGVSVNQVSPPGAISSEQVLIIENDRFGNQRVLSIGSPGTVVTGPKPCVRDKPTASMDCTKQDLRGVQWNGARLSSGRFDGADLRGASLHGAQLENASFNEARLDDVDLATAQLVNASFHAATMPGVKLEGAKLINNDFVDADLSRANLRGATLVNADFHGADLTQADLSGAQLVNADFGAARLSQATWTNGQPCSADSESVCGH